MTEMNRARLDYLAKTKPCFDMLEVGRKYKLENIINLSRSMLIRHTLDYSDKSRTINESLKD